MDERGSADPRRLARCQRGREHAVDQHQLRREPLGELVNGTRELDASGLGKKPPRLRYERDAEVRLRRPAVGMGRQAATFCVRARRARGEHIDVNSRPAIDEDLRRRPTCKQRLASP
jgi:hypothetical protein